MAELSLCHESTLNKVLPSERTERTDLFVSGLGMVSLLPTSGKFIPKLITQTHQSPFQNASMPITLRKLFPKPNLVALKLGYVLLSSCCVCFHGNITLQIKYYFPFSGFYLHCMFVSLSAKAVTLANSVIQQLFCSCMVT